MKEKDIYIWPVLLLTEKSEQQKAGLPINENIKYQKYA